MRFYRIISIISFLIFSEIALSYPADVETCFTPGDRCDFRLIDALYKAHESVYVQAYQLTSKPIQDAIVDASKRGVKVEVILDKSQARQKGYSPALFFHNMQIPVWIDNKPAISHNKVMIIDDDLVITGSYNFSRAAQYRNAENMVFIRSKDIAGEYLNNFQKRLKVSQYVGI